MDPASSLRSAASVDSGAEIIRKRAARLTAPHRSEREKARSIFEYVRDAIAYNFAPDVRGPEHFRASYTLELGNGFCMQKAALFAALCRAADIPARVGFQDIADYKLTGRFAEFLRGNELTHHGMNAIYLNGQWIRVDCTLDRGLVERKHYRLVKFDGVREALLPKTDLAGKRHFTILRQRAFYNDTPQFAIRTMIGWTQKIPYGEWRLLVHGKDGSM
jgi:transglutaminase-like putative cysteine protease